MTDRHIGSWEMPATWFQSVGPLAVIILAPVFAALWSWLGRRNLNPSQPTKVWLALFLLGGGFVFMVFGAHGTTPQHRASMFWLNATYIALTFGELCISPTGLSFVTKAAPVRHVSFLMGIWFLSNAIANKVGGQIAGQTENIGNGKVRLFWYRWFQFHDQADFFFFFVVLACGAGLVALALTPLLKRLLHGRG
jgi:POT family proton-dependent oligopeptide transporter